MRTSIALLTLAILLLPSSAPRAAEGDAACCVQTTSRLNSILDPVNRGSGDEQFFTSNKTKPNVLIILDQSEAMHAWTIPWSEIWKDMGQVNGCHSSLLNGKGYAGIKDDPAYKTCSDTDFRNGVQGCVFLDRHPEFDVANSYKVGERGCMEDYGAPDCTPYSGTDGACTGLGLVESAHCSVCLPWRGYYLHKNASGAVEVRITGKFGQFYKPRDTMIRDLARDIKRVTVGDQVRQGFMTTRNQTGGSLKVRPWFVPSSGGGGGKGGGGSTTTTTSTGTCIHLLNKASEPVFAPACGTSDPNLSSPLNMIEGKMTFDVAGSTANCGFPLADMLYAGAHYMRGPAGVAGDPFANWFGSGFPTAASTDNKGVNEYNSPSDGFSSICGSCYFNAVVAITAGQLTAENKFVKEGEFVAPTALPKITSATDNPCAGCSYTAQMAKWFWKNDLRVDASTVTWNPGPTHAFPGKQNVATYIVSLTGNSSPALTQIAKVGGGQVFLAQTGEGLVKALNDALTDVLTRSTSFSAASVSFLQNATTTLNAIMPRMTPARAPDPWTGQLWHFRLFNEFVEEFDKDNNGSKSDVFITDSEGGIVTENDEGIFIHKDTTNVVRIEEVDWEAGNKLQNDGHSGRNIWTVVDSNADGQLTDSDPVVAFSTTNLSTLLPYLGIVGAKDAEGRLYCPTGTSLTNISDPGLLLGRLELTATEAAATVGITAASSQSDLNTLCAKLLIQYVRGQDLLDEDYDGDRTDTRLSILGDIFHSSPVTVTAPVDAFLCDLGLSNQCVRTLYAQQLGDNVKATEMDKYTVGEKDCLEQDVTRTAYEKYAWDWRKRQELVVVGANDGMLHAFDNGEFLSQACDGGLASVTMTKGTGAEVWAFIPPDLLPRLVDSMLEHTYLVDGDIMVRDIWNDDNKDGKKQHSEYRTLVVGSEGRGGTHYFALELDFDSATYKAKAPKFRWIFPQPCSEEASEFGKTLYALSPKPPPVGPLLVDTETVGNADKSTPVTRYGRPTQEQWMVALSGGWSPSLSLGRGIYFVDAYRGKVNGRDDNLWWKMTYQPGAVDDVHKPLAAMKYSIVAPVALLDYGKNDSPALDGFFDTAIVGDTGGQVWLARMRVPGRVESTSKLIDNWSGARAFEQAKGSASVAARYPIWFLASTAIQTDYGYLRAFFGGGDRYAVLEKYAGTCNFYNPVACVKYGCKSVATSFDLDRSTVDLTAGMSWTTAGSPAATTVAATRTVASATKGVCDAASASYTSYSVNSCTLGTANNGNLVQTKVDCAKSGDYYSCSRSDTAVPKDDLIGGSSTTVPDATTLGGLGKPRFFGAWVYGGSRAFVEDGTSTTQTPAVYDNGRLTDSDLCNTTRVTCTATGCSGGPTTCSSGATNTGKGWFVEYEDIEGAPTNASLEHKTATGAVVMSSCVLWNTIYPVTQQTSGSECGVFVKSKGRFYQSDFISGAPNCAYSFLKADQTYSRFQERSVLAPPPEPATVVQISKSGNIKYSAMLLEPGASKATEIGVSQSSDMLQTIYELPVSRAMHECRHGNKDNCVVTAP